MNLSIITAVIAVAAIISPIFVALINNHHSYRMRQLDIKREIGQQRFDSCHTEKVRAYSDFVDNSASFNMNRDNRGIYSKFLSSANKALLLCRKENQKAILIL